MDNYIADGALANFGVGNSRLVRLLGFLETDPDNTTLLAEAANAALDESSLTEAIDLIERYRALETVTPSLMNIEGIARMRLQNHDAAKEIFQTLMERGHNLPPVRFNLAWLAALDNRYGDSLDLLDDEVVQVVPRAASLKVQALHHLERIDEALEFGQEMAELFPADNYLLGALSVAAMDADDFELARHYAMLADGGADALTTQGLLHLSDDSSDAALELFDRALSEHPNAARAWLGKGLGLLSKGNADAASICLDKGAGIFGDDLGSWIASGWTHFIRKDLEAARRSFETALANDDNFAETHGALAVLDIAEGKTDSARRRADIALRLDKECFGGVLARTLLLEIDGKPELAAIVRDRAMNMPMGIDGKTLAQAMIGLGMNSGGNKGGI